MSATSFTVYDGEATPVAHVMVPIGNTTTENGTNYAHTWREFLPSLPDEGQLTVVTSRKKLKSGTQVLVASYNLPVMEVPSGNTPGGYEAPAKVAFVERVDVVKFKPRRSTELTARKCLMIALNHCADRQTTAAAITSGVAADLLQRGIVAG